MSWTWREGFLTSTACSTTPALLAVASGLALGLGLIVAIGAQNAFVLRQGLRLEHVAAVVAVCALSDLALIVAGVLGAGAALSRVPWLIPVVCFAGAAFLLCYGLPASRAGRRLRRSRSPGSATAPGQRCARASTPARSARGRRGADRDNGQRRARAADPAEGRTRSARRWRRSGRGRGQPGSEGEQRRGIDHELDVRNLHPQVQLRILIHH